jgi:hypothetical protein
MPQRLDGDQFPPAAGFGGARLNENGTAVG